MINKSLNLNNAIKFKKKSNFCFYKIKIIIIKNI